MTDDIRTQDGAQEMNKLREELNRIKEYDEQLRLREELYRTIFETAGTAIITIDGDTTIRIANSNFEKLSGYSKDELEGKMSWAVFIAEGDLDRMWAYHEKRRLDQSSAPYEYEFRFVNRAGEILDILLNIAMIPGTNQSVASCMDITARKRAEEALRLSEENYRNILESIQEVYCEVDLKGNFTFFNPRAWGVLGYSKEELTNMNFRDYMDADNTRKVFDAYHRVFVTGEPIPAFEYDVIMKNRERLPVEASISLRRDGKGKAVGFKGVVRDITQRKEAEKARRQSEEKYRNILESIQEGYYETDFKGNFTFFNDSFCGMVGYAPEEVMGSNYRVFVDRETARKIYDVFHRVYLTGNPDKGFDWSIVRKDGEKKAIEISVTLIKGPTGEPIGFRGVMRDITERRQAQDALRLSEERFRDLAELLPETVYEAELDGRLTFVNKSGLACFGYDELDIKQGLRMRDVVPPEEIHKLQENLAKMFKGEKTGLVEYMAVRKDGTTFPGLAHSAPIMRAGNVVGVRGFLVDISEKKSLEARLLHAQRMESIGTLAGGIAHDFNNLLMGILGNASLMMMGMDETNTLYARLRNIEGYVKRASDLTQQLLGFARGGKYDVRLTDLGEFIIRSTNMFARTHKEIRVHTLADRKVWPVEVDQNQMEQVMLNLYMNARQAMPGGGDLYVAMENAELTDSTADACELPPGNYVKITLRDTGVGMDEATKARIFDPFFTTKEMGRGTGLGLASVYGIVKNHGGYVGVESEVGVGTEFFIYLPVSIKHAEREVSVEEEAKSGSGCVLLVDDEEMILDVASAMIEGLGYRVIKAKGGKAGLEEFSARHTEIDLVVLDMVMPDLAGKEVFVRMKEIYPEVRVLLSSGYSLDDQAKEILESGCRGFIQKPFNLPVLSMRIREVLA
ncbi:MAG: PAS domain S-box protein [Desulfomonilia bacterium]|jgi:PAS domain S-box-containing protein